MTISKLIRDGMFRRIPDDGAGAGSTTVTTTPDPAAAGGVSTEGEVVFGSPDDFGSSSLADDLDIDGGRQAATDTTVVQDAAAPIKYEGGKIVFGEESFTPEELKDRLEKGGHFTQEMQKLRAAEAQLQPVIQMANFVNSLPPAAVEELALAAREIDERAKSGAYAGGAAPFRGLQTTTLPTDPKVPFEVGGIKINPADYDEGGQQLLGVVRHLVGQNAQLAQAFAHVNGQLTAVRTTLPEVQSALQGVVGDREATTTAAKIKADWGQDVDPAALRQLQKQTGISDMEAAWLKANAQTLRNQTFDKGHQQGTRPKPKTPAGGANTFNSNDPNMSTQQIFRNLKAGMTDVAGTTQ